MLQVKISACCWQMKGPNAAESQPDLGKGSGPSGKGSAWLLPAVSEHAILWCYTAMQLPDASFVAQPEWHMLIADFVHGPGCMS